MAGSRNTRVATITVCVLALIVVGAAGALLLSQSDYQYHLTNVTGSQPSLKLFGARGTDGEARSAQDYAGKITIVYMGYTHCPDVCPTALAKLHAVLEQLGPETAAHIQVLFETVDPKRDTLTILKDYARAFDTRFRGLRLTGDNLDTFEDRHHISVTYGKPNADGSYKVNHSSGVFVFDGDASLRLIGSGATSVSDWVADISHLVAGLD